MALDIVVILPYTVSRTYQPMEIDMAHCITYISADGKDRVEVHMLNVGDAFPGFGGSSSSLVARKTASLVTRHAGAWGFNDREWDIHSPKAWAWLAALTTKHGFTAAPAVKLEEDA